MSDTIGIISNTSGMSTTVSFPYTGDIIIPPTSTDTGNVWIDLTGKIFDIPSFELSKESDNGIASNIMFEELSNRILIRGVLLSEGIWKGMKYTYEEMKKAVELFKKTPGKVDHCKDSRYGDKTIGNIIDINTDDTLRCLTFQAEVTDPDAKIDVRSGKFDAVSVKLGFKEVDRSGSVPMGIGYLPVEWSLTGSPACENCMIFGVQALSKTCGCPNSKDNLNNVTNPPTIGTEMSKPEDKTVTVPPVVASITTETKSATVTEPSKEVEKKDEPKVIPIIFDVQVNYPKVDKVIETKVDTGAPKSGEESKQTEEKKEGEKTGIQPGVQDASSQRPNIQEQVTTPPVAEVKTSMVPDREEIKRVIQETIRQGKGADMAADLIVAGLKLKNKEEKDRGWM
jgi:hypothetical protein